MHEPTRPHYHLVVQRIVKFFDKNRTPLWQRALLLSLVLLVPLVAVGVVFIAPQKHAKADVTTVSKDLLRTGWYSSEPNLSPNQVTSNNFGQLYSSTVDGQVYAQPLVSQNTLLVATETNHVYGLDPATGAQKWTPLYFGTPFNAPRDLGCGDISPSVGITSTPVIDPATNIAYLTAKTYVSGTTGPAIYSMHAINVATGQEVSGFPVPIQGTASNDPSHPFDGTHHLQRPGLLLLNGVVYAAFGSHCDRKPFEGWVVGVSTAGRVTTLWSDEAGVPQSSFPEGGIWQSGGGLLSDGPNQIVLATGNGSVPPSPTPGKVPPSTLGQSVVRLIVQSDGTLKATDFFSPYDADFLNGTDSDIGSGSPVGLPSQYFGTPTYPHLLAQIGKQGNLYILNADNLGGRTQGPNSSDAVISRVGQVGGVWGRPAAWPGDGGYIYITTAQGGGGTGRLKALKYGLDGSGKPTFNIIGQSSDLFGFSSSPAVITSSGTASGSSVLWVVWSPDGTGVNGQLRAYNPVPVNGTLQMIQSWPIGTASKFDSPSVDNGHVFVGTRDGHVIGFGSPVPTPLTGTTVDFPSTIIGQTSTAAAKLTANVAETVNSIAVTGTDFTVGTSTPALPATLNAGDTINVPVTFAPTGHPGLFSGILNVTTSAGSANFGLSGNGESASATINVAPATISFGGVSIAGGSASSNVTFSNNGAQPLTINNATLPAAPFTVSGLPANGSTIASNSSVTATVTFTPTTVGSFQDNLTLNTSAGPAVVPLSGNGGQPPKLQITPTNTNLGDVSVGATAVTSFNVTNAGGVNLTITKSKPPVSGVGFAAYTSLAEGTTIPPGQSITETVTFSPTTTGTASDAWILNSDDPSGQLQQINFVANGVAAVPAKNFPLPSLYVTSTSVFQPTSGTTQANVTISLDAPSSSPITVLYATKDGTATTASGAYVAIPATPITFNPGDVTKTVSVTVNGSSTKSFSGQFKVLLSRPTNAVIGNGTSRINIIPTSGISTAYGITVGDVVVNASSTSNVTANFPVTLSSVPVSGDTVTVTVATADGSATLANGDYVAVPATTLTFNSTTGATQNVAVTVNKIAAGTTNKRFFLNLSAASSNATITHGQGMATIVNGGGAALPSVYGIDTTVVPPLTGTTTTTFTVQLGAPSTSTVTVKYATHDGTATVANGNYVATNGTLTFPAGTTSQTVTVTVNAGNGGGAKFFYLNLSGAVGAVINTISSRGNLVGNVGGYFAYVSDEAVVQNKTASSLVLVPVSLSSVVPSGTTVAVTVSTADGTAIAGTDYVAIAGTKLTFAEGQQTIMVPVYINPNTATSANKTFTINLKGSSSNITIADASATVTIVSHA